MKKAELIKKSQAELVKHAAKLREQLVEAKRAPHMQEVRNVKATRNLRRELARTLTLANRPAEK